ncbi:MAG TPA: hypothetical protein VFY84_07280 [Jiangellales bacterium]|nr:hypothetical protein [Jiangellales bacterium]
MRKELTLSELNSEHLELLPARETLNFNSNWAQVVASNTSLALNAASYQSNAWSAAFQSISVDQD